MSHAAGDDLPRFQRSDRGLDVNARQVMGLSVDACRGACPSPSAADLRKFRYPVGIRGDDAVLSIRACRTANRPNLRGRAIPEV